MVNPFTYDPHPLAKQAAEELQAYIAANADVKEAADEGKMFGVLVVSPPWGDGRGAFFAAYSGLLGGRNDWPWFVPPVFDAQQPDGYFKTHEREISDINHEIERLEQSEEYARLKSAHEEAVKKAQEAVSSYKNKVEKAKALGMSVSALDPFLSDEQILAGGATPVHSVEELYAAADYLSIHIPALPSTIGSIGYDLITRMPKGATLINTARKEVIDEQGLMKALEDRPDLKYVTDVMPDNYAALQEKFGLRVFATPKKMGAQTAEANINAGLAAARQIVVFFATGNTRFQVNK